MVLFIPDPTPRSDGCRWPMSARRFTPCGIDDAPLDFYGQDSPGSGCVQDCGAGSDIKFALRVYLSSGAVTYGKENCFGPNQGVIGGAVVYLGRAWNRNLWTSSVVVEWWAYRWNPSGGSMALIRATWLGVSKEKANVGIIGINGERCATVGTLVCRCTCFDDGTFTFQ